LESDTEGTSETTASYCYSFISYVWLLLERSGYSLQHYLERAGLRTNMGSGLKQL
jgi:hypothetical protein